LSNPLMYHAHLVFRGGCLITDFHLGRAEGVGRTQVLAPKNSWSSRQAGWVVPEAGDYNTLGRVQCWGGWVGSQGYAKGMQLFSLKWPGEVQQCSPHPNSCPPNSSERDLVWKSGLCRCNELRVLR
jgi:hypothetical protein